MGKVPKLRGLLVGRPKSLFLTSCRRKVSSYSNNVLRVEIEYGDDEDCSFGDDAELPRKKSRFC